MQKSHKFVLFGLIGTVVLAGVGTAYFLYQKNHSVKEETISIFSNVEGEAPYSDLLGNPVSLNVHLGKVLVVATWASWSPFSAGDLKMLNDLATELNNDGVVFMAINRKETKEQAARFLSTQPNFERLLLVLDPRDHFYSSVEGYAMPEVVIYNNLGEVVLHERGVANKDNIAASINDALSKNE